MNQTKQDITINDDDTLTFMDEGSTFEENSEDKWKILVVDDEQAIHAVTNIVLKTFSLDNKKTTILNAYNIPQAKEFLTTHKDIALILLDVVMETDSAGLDLVKYIRNDLKNNDIKIIIRTGQAGLAPELEVIKKYDIDDYKEKTDLSNVKLFSTIYAAIKSYRDIQKLKKLQKELEKKESLLNKAQNLSRMGCWEWDIYKDEVVCSDAAYKILELDIKPKHSRQVFLDFVHPDDLEKRAKVINKVIETAEPYSLEYRVVLKNGDILYMDEKGEAITDENGKAIKLFGVSIDITKQKEVERVKEENELIQRQLYKQKLKENEQKKIADAKDSFLILFTHELKTPLNAIINFNKYLLKHVHADTIDKIPLLKREKLLKQIDISATQMLDDVTKILELSKIRSNKLEYKISSFNLCDVLTEIIENHDALCEEKGVGLSVQYASKQLYVQSDAYRLGQIFANVISNAIKYSKGKVHISVNNVDDKYIVIIQDNGPGMLDTEKAFDLFEQFDSSITKRSKQGTGIGLNFVKYLCQDLNIEYKLNKSQELGGLSFELLINKSSK
ncbi:ATP-binding protein [Sulfurospirillum arcachonense]|uniref:ATP-binding protein n=1 Tax=Sulfurospirillum arcachonense TaxID=57666 RepID=UPI00046801B8|nr:ATP-binding protein [Sulfurospirillum arcachonense]